MEQSAEEALDDLRALLDSPLAKRHTRERLLSKAIVFLENVMLDGHTPWCGGWTNGSCECGRVSR